MKKQSSIIFIFITVLFFSSCQMGKELHYIKDGKNYYRIKINEVSFASKSRYLSGFFDVNALEKYFGEMKQPSEDDEKNDRSSKSSDYTFKEVIDASGNTSDKKEKKLMMVLSTNSDAIANQIGMLVDNEEMLKNIAYIANKDKIESDQSYINNINGLEKQKHAIEEIGNKTLAVKPDSIIIEEAKNNILTFLLLLKAQTTDQSTLNQIDLLINDFKTN